MINIRRVFPESLTRQEQSILKHNEKEIRNRLIMSAYIYDAKLVSNLSNKIVNVRTGRLRSSHFVGNVAGRLAVIIGVGTNYAGYVDDKKDFMDITWRQVENRIDTIMGAE